MASMRSAPKMRMRSSCSDRKNFDRPGIALAARASAQLVVDAAALVALGADDVEAAGVDRLLPEGRDFRADRRLLGGALFLRSVRVDFLLHAHLDVAAELDVGAAAGHVGGDGDRARDAGLGDDQRLLLVEAGVEYGEILRRLAGARRGVERLQRVGLGEVDLLVAVPLEHFAEQSRTSRSMWCRPASAASWRWRPRSRARRRASFPRSCDRPRRPRRDARSVDWSGSRRRSACRSRRIRPPPSRPCRSCRRASCRDGNSSGT